MLTTTFSPSSQISASDFRRAKLERRKLSMVTCYDYTFARLLNKSGVDALLVGDSAGMVMHGHSSTVAVSLDLMRLHTEAVVRGAPDKFIIVDLPFLSFRKGVGQLRRSANTHERRSKRCEARGCRWA